MVDTTGSKRAFAWNAVFILCSLVATAIMGVALPLGDPNESELAEAAIIIIFFSCYITLLVSYWYRNTYLPAQTDDTD